MAEPSSPEKTEKPTSGAESPTTARPLDFDDEQQETGVIASDGTATPARPPRTSSQRNVHFDEGDAPPKPPRPASPQQQAESTLIEAFPSIDSKVVKAVLTASGGQVEPAFNALLGMAGMSDPNFQEEHPPPQPPRPTQQQRQLQEDEMYARQLAEHYQASAQPQPHASATREGRPMRRDQDPDDKEYSFFDDELPQIRENMRQGFLQTQTKVNKWITDFRKRIDGEEDEDEIGPGPASTQQRQNFGSSQTEQLRGIRKEAERTRQERRSTDQDRYDADPQVLSDNFSELELRDEEAPPQKPARPLANPDLFKPTPAPPQSGPVDEVDALYRQPTPNSKTARQPSPSSGNKSKKWQPLTSVAPAPEPEENDPFSLGDSDEERDKQTDLKADDTERLKKAASQTSASQDNDDGKKTLEPSESVGVRNKDAEDILKGSSPPS
ncbi:MAG: ubiquitin-binding protein cue5 [Chrysothrix sp. TS-e1954]|nr:MAG: ubiquitin-binding protein cue5 [Chrysothrix sp. TS-e1954]